MFVCSLGGDLLLNFLISSSKLPFWSGWFGFLLILPGIGGCGLVSGFGFDQTRFGGLVSGLVFTSKFWSGGVCGGFCLVWLLLTVTRNLSIQVWFSFSGFEVVFLLSCLILFCSRFLKKFRFLLILLISVFRSCSLGCVC